MPNNFILESIDLINQTTEDSQCDVLLALEDVYQKQLMLYESAIDPAYMESIMFMEAKNDTSDNVTHKYTDVNGNEVQKPAPIRSQSVIAKLIRMIKRVWQQILTMVTKAIMNHSVRKLKSLMDKAEDGMVPVPHSDTVYKNTMEQLSDRKIELGDPEGLVSWLKNTEQNVNQKNLWVGFSEDKNNSKTEKFVPKDLILKYIDAHMAYFDTLRDAAKTVDKLTDNTLTTDGSSVMMKTGDDGHFTESKLSDEDIKVINRATTILFKDLRARMELFTHTIDCISARFGEGKKSNIIVQDSVTANDITVQIRHLLLGSKLSKQDKDHAVIVFDAVNSTDDDLKNTFLNKSTYNDVLNPLPAYPTVIGIFLANKHSGSVKKWKIIKAKTLDPSVKKMLGSEGVAIVKNTDDDKN